MSNSVSFDLANTMLRLMGLPLLNRKAEEPTPIPAATEEPTPAKEPGRISRLWKTLVTRLGLAWVEVKAAAKKVVSTVANSRAGQAVKAAAVKTGAAIKRAAAPVFNWIATKVLQGAILMMRGIEKLDKRFENSQLYPWLRLIALLTMLYFIVYGIFYVAGAIAAWLLSWIPGVLGSLLVAAFSAALGYMACRAFFNWSNRAFAALKGEEVAVPASGYAERRWGSSAATGATETPSQPTEEGAEKKQ